MVTEMSIRNMPPNLWDRWVWEKLLASESKEYWRGAAEKFGVRV
jgi:hypothetical protein